MSELNRKLKIYDEPKKLADQVYIEVTKNTKDIFKTLLSDSSEYNPKITIKSMQKYLDNSPSNMMERILYSEISNHIFSLDESSRGAVTTNIEKLFRYVLEDDHIKNDCRKIAIKIYDHFQLSLIQIENMKVVFNNNIKTVEQMLSITIAENQKIKNDIEETKGNFYKELKGVEKGYISILGIFSSIILTFVGGITFSSSVLENINSVSIYRLLMTIDLLALVLINVIYMLLKFILVINDKSYELIRVKVINNILILFAFGIIIMWLLNAHSLSQFFNELLPW